LVRQTRTLDLEGGQQRVSFTGTAALLDPTTVRLEALGDADLRVLDQQFVFDLVSQARLLEKYIGEEVSLRVSEGDSARLIRGELLSANPTPIVRDDNGRVHIVNDPSSISLSSLPGGLVLTPTLRWTLLSGGGEVPVRVSYETRGITWWADYTLVFTPEAGDTARGRVDLSAWVSLLNRSGKSYENAELKLMAGEVNRQPQGRGRQMARMEMAAMAADAGGFEEQSLFEYHLYTLGRPATIPDRGTYQLELFEPVEGVPAEREYLVDSVGGRVWVPPRMNQNAGLYGSAEPEVGVSIVFANSEAGGLGMPLPRGRVRVNQADPNDGTPEFVGEDSIDHTPRDEEVRVRVGTAFDVKAERRSVRFRAEQPGRVVTETIEVELRNRKSEAVTVRVQEPAYRWTEWEIVDSTVEHERVDSQRFAFELPVPAGETRTLRYTIRYTSSGNPEDRPAGGVERSSGPARSGVRGR